MKAFVDLIQCARLTTGEAALTNAQPPQIEVLVVLVLARPTTPRITDFNNIHPNLPIPPSTIQCNSAHFEPGSEALHPEPLKFTRFSRYGVLIQAMRVWLQTAQRERASFEAFSLGRT